MEIEGSRSEISGWSHSCPGINLLTVKDDTKINLCEFGSVWTQNGVTSCLKEGGFEEKASWSYLSFFFFPMETSLFSVHLLQSSLVPTGQPSSLSQSTQRVQWEWLSHHYFPRPQLRGYFTGLWKQWLFIWKKNSLWSIVKSIFYIMSSYTDTYTGLGKAIQSFVHIQTHKYIYKYTYINKGFRNIMRNILWNKTVFKVLWYFPFLSMPLEKGLLITLQADFMIH